MAAVLDAEVGKAGPLKFTLSCPLARFLSAKNNIG